MDCYEYDEDEEQGYSSEYRDSDIDDEEEDMMTGDDEEDDADNREGEGDEEMVFNKQRYTILSEADISKQQQDDISQVSSMLSISKSSSIILLRKYKWNADAACEAWFADEDKIREELGLLVHDAKPGDEGQAELYCGICLEYRPRETMRAAGCGHRYCYVCWRGYIGTSVTDGPGCLMLHCPHPSCPTAVGQDMVDALADEEHRDKYARFLLRSYVEDSKRLKWCPSPDCETAVGLAPGSESTDVQCDRCSGNFCWNCTEEAHRPVDCSTVAKWVLKNSSESENTLWILANSKACPGCKKSIEKNQGCMHMTCSCRHEFCWLCLGPWKKHNADTGGFYACNRYKEAKLKGEYKEADIIRKRAKASVDKYAHFYERWLGNHKSREKAAADLRELRAGKLEEVGERMGEPVTQTEFVAEAWAQVVECRRVLKWTYAYGYYLEGGGLKMDFFEYAQGEAEEALERLHVCAEKEFEVYADAESPVDSELKDGFREFKMKLSGLTRVTANYFNTLVTALEAGLQEVAVISDEDTADKEEETKKYQSRGRRRRRRWRRRDTEHVPVEREHVRVEREEEEEEPVERDHVPVEREEEEEEEEPVEREHVPVEEEEEDEGEEPVEREHVPAEREEEEEEPVEREHVPVEREKEEEEES